MQSSVPFMRLETLRADALAGLLGAILALPQGIAFAKLAGLPPQYGIYSAIVPCAVAAMAGSSRHVVSGPTNANSLALFAALAPLATAGSPHYIALALAVTALVGAIQLAVGALRLAWITDFISPAVLIGFISGAAILIGLYSLPDMFGAPPPSSHGPLSVVAGLPDMLARTKPAALLVAFVTLLATSGAAAVSRKCPYLLIGLGAGIAADALLASHGGIEPVAHIGAIPSVLPPFSLPLAPASSLPDLFYVAGALAIVAAGQSVSIAKALAERSGQQIDVDREFIGQGLSNVVGAFFSCYVSCGSLNRSLPNLLAGARTAMAALLSAVFLLVLALLSRPLLERIPIPAIGALLAYVAVGLIDIRGFVRLARVSRIDLVIAAATLIGMLVLPFQQAILIGMALSIVVFLHRTAHPVVLTLLPDRTSPDRTFTPLDELPEPTPECPQLKLVRIGGAVYFGAASSVARTLDRMRREGPQRHLLIMARSMNFIDVAGAGLWERELSARRAAGGDLYFHRPRASVRTLWDKSGYAGRLGQSNVFVSKRAAIAAIYDRLDKERCRVCQARIFKECERAAGAPGRGISPALHDRPIAPLAPKARAGGARN